MMADDPSWYSGLLGNYTTGIEDPQLKQQAISQGLLGLGSALLANQYYDPRNPGSGGLAKGLAEGGQALMQAPKEVRMAAYQDAVMKQKLQEFQIKQAQQKALQNWAASLPADDPRRSMAGIAPDKVVENELALGLERGKYGLKKEYEPQIAGLTEEAKNPALIRRDLSTAEGRKKLDYAYDPRTAAATFAAVNPYAIARTAGSVGKASEDAFKKQQSAQSVESILNEIEPMKRDEKTGQMVPDLSKSVLERSTHSGVGAGLDWMGRQIGVSTDSGDSAAKLKVLGNALMMGMPRMEGPQSDKDVVMYREAAGNLSDPGTPTSQKRAALEVIRTLNARYASPQGGNGGWSMRPVGGQ